MKVSETEIAKLAENIIGIESKWEERKSQTVNVIDSMAYGESLREEAHSRLLAAFLKVPQIQESFLEYFLKVKSPEKLDVETEKEKVDIQLHSQSKELIILIENKINDAPEMQSQIARYVETVRTEGYKNIFVVYLNSNHHALPTEHSLSLNGKSVFKVISPERFKVLSYKHDITNWFKGLEQSAQDPILKSALIQYINYLEVKFNNTEMEREIRLAIDNAMHFGQEESAISKVEALRGSGIDKDKKCKPYFQRYTEDLSTTIVAEWLNEVRMRYGNLELITDEFPIFEIPLKCGATFGIRNHRYDTFTPSWMFWANNKKETVKAKCKEIADKAGLVIDKDLQDEKSEGELFYGYTSDGVETFSKVYEAAKELNQL